MQNQNINIFSNSELNTLQYNSLVVVVSFTQHSSTFASKDVEMTNNTMCQLQSSFTASQHKL